MLPTSLKTLHFGRVINCSFERGFFPKSLNLASETPLFKGEIKLELNKYIPMSVISIVGKIVEECIFTRFSVFVLIDIQF